MSKTLQCLFGLNLKAEKKQEKVFSINEIFCKKIITI